MTTFGLGVAGFIPMTLDDIIEELRPAYRAIYGENLDLDERSPDGMHLALYAEREASLWGLLQACADVVNPDNAEDAQQDALCALTGTRRHVASYSTMLVTCTGTPGTVLPVGRVVTVAGTGSRFVSTAAGTIGGGGTVDVAFTAEVSGPLVATHGTLQIETPVGGWDSAENTVDATVGSDVEGPDVLRLRREEELHGAAGSPVEAIKNRVLEVPGVTGCVVYENIGMVADGDGRPPKSIEAVVSSIDTLDAAGILAIRTALLGTAADPRGAAGGIEIWGTSIGTVVDSNGFSHDVGYSPAEVLSIYVRVALSVDVLEFASDGADQAELAVLAYQTELVLGKDVIGRAIGARLFRMLGVLDAVVTVGTTGAAADPSVTVSPRQIAELDSTRLTIVVSPGTP